MNEKQMQHGLDYNGQDVTGYIATEKLNGCRAYWDGQKLWSRGGLEVKIPSSWKESLPAGVSLDGEIYDGKDGVYRCGTAIRLGRFTPSMSFVVFDCPDAGGDYLARLNTARKYAGGPVFVVDAYCVQNYQHAEKIMNSIKGCGGEGIMLRHPALPYSAGRTDKMLKLKYRWESHD